MEADGPDSVTDAIEVSGKLGPDQFPYTQFPKIIVNGDVEFIGLRVRDVNLTGISGNVKFTDCSIDGLKVTDDGKAHPGFIIDSCSVTGLKLNANFSGKVSILRTRLGGMSVFQCSGFTDLEIKETNCEYVNATEMHADRIDLALSRFVQLFDMNNSSFGTLNLEDTIVLETFRLPAYEKNRPIPSLILNGITLNGKMILEIPGDSRFERELISTMYRINNSSGMAALRAILESNRKFSAADTAFMYQKRREADKDDTGFETNDFRRALNRLSYVFSGNGMRPTFTLGWMVAVMLFFAAVYSVLGISLSTDVTGNGILNSIYLSIISFFICNIFSIGGTGMILTAVEGIIGILMMLFFTVILTRKLIR